MLKSRFFALMLIAAPAFAADLPVREVILYKHGVAYFERSGELKPGETARLDFKADDMNDVLKSLTLVDRNGAKISGVRYDASEPLEKRLENFPFAVGDELSMAAFLDQMKGARVELKAGAQSLGGEILSARTIKPEDKDKSPQRELVTLMMDSGELRTFDLGSVASVAFSDPKMQSLLRDYLAVLGATHSKDRRSIYIDASTAGLRELFARYMTPAPIWKSSYRLIFGGKPSDQVEPTLEGWAIVDNTTGEDWNNVKLSVVSGKPISFITQLYPARYVDRPAGELAENLAVAPQVFEGTMMESMGAASKTDKLEQFARIGAAPPPATAPRSQSMASVVGGGGIGSGRGGGIGQGQGGGFGGGTYAISSQKKWLAESTISSAEGHDTGELFEYDFSGPITVKKGESAMLPFLQQKLKTRKLLIYSENFGLHPLNAAELTNTTGKTLDGGPITIYEGDSYAGEALVETVKAGDKRLISYGVDLGARVTTKFDSGKDVIREIHMNRGFLTTRGAVDETKTYTIRNVDGKAKTVIIEHPKRDYYKLLGDKPGETTASAYRFEVKLGSTGTESYAVHEERVFEQTFAMVNMTSEVLGVWIQNKALTETGRQQLEQIAAKKREITQNDADTRRVDSDLNDLDRDQNRTRQNIESLNRVNGQQELVQQYAKQLAGIESKLATLRDRQSQLRTSKTRLDAELSILIDKLEF